MRTRPRSALATLTALATLATGFGGVTAAGAAEPAIPSPRFAREHDRGVVDTDGDGASETAAYGVPNAGLSVGEQGRMGWNLRYFAPVTIYESDRRAVAEGARAILSFRVWRTENLGGRKLVVTALHGGRADHRDFTRKGREVFRGTPKAGMAHIDVTEAVRSSTDHTLSFRFQLDRAPSRADGVWTQVNIATADSRLERNRPRLRYTAPDPSSPTPTTVAPTTTTTTTAPTTTAKPVASSTLVFADEFNGTSLNTNVWKPYHSTYGDGNNELQCHTPGNVSVSGGTLKITARRQTVTCPNGPVRQFTGGFLGTRDTGTYFPRYGRYEIRARLPHGQGLWPAFWLRHRNGAQVAEVDVMEYFHSQVPGKTTGTLHLDGRYNISKQAVPFEAPTASPGWHTWAVEIAPAGNGDVRFTFSLDGDVYHSYTDTKATWATAYAGQPLFDMAVNLSVGGDWTGHPDLALGYLDQLGRCAQGGTPPNGCETTGIRRATFPATYEVDYIRVHRL